MAARRGEEGGVVNASTAIYEEGSGDVGAIIMGRNMFGGGPGPWDGNGIATLGLEQVRVIEAPGVTHLTYRRVG